MTAQKRVLITGASGFIGTHVVQQLRAADPTVVIAGLDVRTPAPDLALDEFLQTDICDGDLARDFEAFRPDAVIHLAAVCKEPGYPWREYYRVNTDGTRRLAQAAAAARVANIVFTSTMMVYAAGPWRRAEADQADAETAYGGSKLAAELVLKAWRAGLPGRRLRIVRPGVVFGPGDYGNMVRLIRALRRKRFVFAGRRDTVKGCIYVRDLSDLLVRTLTDAAPHTTYHAVYREPTTLAAIVDAIRQEFGIGFRPPVVPFAILRALALPFALVDPMGTRFGVHPRRIEKLSLDTNVSAERLADLPWRPRFDLRAAFRDWRTSLGDAVEP